VVEACSVDLRGWDFPHITRDEEAQHVNTEWAGQADEWEHNLELWRMYRSGQFISFSGIPHEWRDQSGFWPAYDGWTAGTHVSVLHIVARFTEALDFAARLSQTKAGDDQMVVSIELRQMAGRFLMLDSPLRMPLRPFYKADVADIKQERSISRADLIARGRTIALELAEDVFTFFSWRPAQQILADLQREIVGGR